MGQELQAIERAYDAVAKEYAETFPGDRERKPKDREILHRFVKEIGEKGTGVS